MSAPLKIVGPSDNLPPPPKKPWGRWGAFASVAFALLAVTNQDKVSSILDRLNPPDKKADAKSLNLAAPTLPDRTYRPELEQLVGDIRNPGKNGQDAPVDQCLDDFFSNLGDGITDATLETVYGQAQKTAGNEKPGTKQFTLGCEVTDSYAVVRLTPAIVGSDDEELTIGMNPHSKRILAYYEGSGEAASLPSTVVQYYADILGGALLDFADFQKDRKAEVARDLDQLAQFATTAIQRDPLTKISLTDACFQSMPSIPDEHGTMYGSALSPDNRFDDAACSMSGNPLTTELDITFTKLNPPDRSDVDLTITLDSKGLTLSTSDDGASPPWMGQKAKAVYARHMQQILANRLKAFMPKTDVK